MSFIINYDIAVVREDIPRLSKRVKGQIKSAIENKLTTEPELFGKPLRKSLKGLRKLRVGDYRVVFRIVRKTVTIYAILHRAVVYREAEKRS